MANKAVVSLQYLFIAIDIIVNAFSDHLCRTVIALLAVYILQDLCLIISTIILILLYFNIKALRSGYLSLIFKRFWPTLFLVAVYLILTVSLQVFCLRFNWPESTTPIAVRSPDEENVDSALKEEITHVKLSSVALKPCLKQNFSLFVVHRLISVAYYFLYKWTSEKLYDEEYIKKLGAANE